MQLIRLAPAGPPEATRRRWTVVASVLLHLAAFALIIGIAARPRPPEPQTPSYDLVFEPSPAAEPQGQGQPPPQADVPTPDDALPGPPAPPPSSPPVPDGVATPLPEAATSAPMPTTAQPAPPPAAAAPPPPQAAAAPTPVAPPPTPAPATVAAPQLAFAPPAPEAELTPAPAPTEIVPTPTPPTVRLETPPETPPVAQAQPIMPQPPPPLPRLPSRPQPQPRATAGTFGNPMDLSFGPAAPRPEARGSRTRGINLALGPPRDGPNRSDPYAQIRAANASADWNRGLLAYWLSHRYYPRQALEAGEDGAVTIELTVARSGRVESVTVVSRSGSQWLDMAAVGTFRDAQLPPFTPEMPKDRITFQIPINYVLIR